ncbi:MAG: hypothetical protein K0T01_2519 [Acidimicrobiia bacterium]|nr:hypothetical protein [Acidimicrobiia bacterium]
MRIGMAILTGIVLLVVGCGGGEAATTTTSTTTTVPTTTTQRTTPTTTVATPTSTLDGTTTTQTIDVTVEAGVIAGPSTVSVGVGDRVSVWVLSDVYAEIHVHGYNVFFEAPAGVPTEVTLTADVPGIFEVELEETHTPLFALEVTP